MLYGDSYNETTETVVPKPLINDIDASQCGTIVTPRNQLQNDVTNIGTGPQYQPMIKSSHLGVPAPPPFVINNSNGFIDVKGNAAARTKLILITSVEEKKSVNMFCFSIDMFCVALMQIRPRKRRKAAAHANQT